ncbi:hypothetical protein SKAU_G00197650 [Synaphobranchus kaupii]|uniref:Uncharacterized protein n=1 Tax=Synaphobranchus kaupii TaxID=118154 RepID=A0A9Q1FES8_SYNKA|nr:hypothetical protein SKAU_G00197650 [Synaphobranchus kaupii]
MPQLSHVSVTLLTATFAPDCRDDNWIFWAPVQGLHIQGIITRDGKLHWLNAKWNLLQEVLGGRMGVAISFCPPQVPSITLRLFPEDRIQESLACCYFRPRKPAETPEEHQLSARSRGSVPVFTCRGETKQRPGRVVHLGHTLSKPSIPSSRRLRNPSPILRQTGAIL